MYNGIGLNTARGSGTNGYVQRNLSVINHVKDKISLKTEADIIRADKEDHKGPNKEILEHARKRALELKCFEMEDIMREEGYNEEETEKKVAQYRAMLMEREQTNKPPLNPFGHANVRETHAVAELQHEKNARLKEAFGISDYFVEGSSLDPDRKAKEEVARLNHRKEEEEELLLLQSKKKKRKYAWVRTPSPSSPSRRSSSQSPNPPHSAPAARVSRGSSSSSAKKEKDKKKKKKHHRERSSSRDSRKRKKNRKKKSRSSTPKKKKSPRDKKKHSSSKKRRKMRDRSLDSRSGSSIVESPTGSPKKSTKEKKSPTPPKDSKVTSSSSHQCVSNEERKNGIEILRGAVKETSPKVDQVIMTLQDDPKPSSRNKNPKDELSSSPKNDSSKSNVPLRNPVTCSSAPPILPFRHSNPLLAQGRSPQFNLSRTQINPPSILNPASEARPNVVYEHLTRSNQMVSRTLKPTGTDGRSAASVEQYIPNRTPVNPQLNPLNSPSIAPFTNFDQPPKDIHPTEQSCVTSCPNGTESTPSEHKESQHKFKVIQSKAFLSAVVKKNVPRSPSRRLRPSWSPSSDRSSSRSSRSRSRSCSSSRDGSRSHRSSKSRSRSKSKSRSMSRSRSRSRSVVSSRSKYYSSRSRSRSKDRYSNRSYSRSYSRSRSSMSRSRSRSRSTTRSRTHSNSRSKSRSKTRSVSSTNSRVRTSGRSRSPSIPRRKGSPSFLDKRRITSARKRPVPYHRPTPPPSSSDSDSSFWSRSPSRSRSRSWSRTTRSRSFSR